MNFQNLLIFVSFVCLMVCVLSSTIVTNSTKSSAQKSAVAYTCSSCYSFNNQVCVDGWCYCKPNYKWTWDTSLSQVKCVYERCYSDYDCHQVQDWERSCSFGTCVCNSGYSEDWDNGRKCTYRVSVWAWVWVFFFVPAVAIAICLCLRRRRMHHHTHAQAHIIQGLPQQPPPYQPPTYGTQQPVTVYRY